MRCEVGLAVAAWAIAACGRDFTPGVPTVISTYTGDGTVPDTISLPAAFEPGNLIVVALVSHNGQQAVSVTDTLGNPFSSAGAFSQSADDAEGAELWYAAAARGGQDIITATAPAGSGVSYSMWVLEVANMSSQPVAAAGEMTLMPIDTISTPPVTTVAPRELVVAVVASEFPFPGVIASGNSFVGTTTIGFGSVGYLVADAPGSYVAEWTRSSTSVGGGCASAVAFWAATP